MSLSYFRCAAAKLAAALFIRNEKRSGALEAILLTCVGAPRPIVVDRDQARRDVLTRNQNLDRHQRVCGVVDTLILSNRLPLIHISSALHEALSSSEGLVF
jgi:hypothetical protein